MALRTHGPPLARDRGTRRGGTRPGRDAPPPLGSILVPGVRMRPRVRLAFERRHDDRLRRVEGRDPRLGGRLRVLRRRRQGRDLSQDAGGDRRRVRDAVPRSRVSRVRQPHGRESRQRGRAGRVSALPPFVPLHAGRPLVRRPAGDERRDRNGAAVPGRATRSRAISSTSPTRPSAATRAPRR